MERMSRHNIGWWSNYQEQKVCQKYAKLFETEAGLLAAAKGFAFPFPDTKASATNDTWYLFYP